VRAAHRAPGRNASCWSTGGADQTRRPRLCWELLLWLPLADEGDWSLQPAASSVSPSLMGLSLCRLSPIAMEKRRWRRRSLMLQGPAWLIALPPVLLVLASSREFRRDLGCCATTFSGALWQQDGASLALQLLPCLSWAGCSRCTC
jgi:hypothetical protein